MHFLAYRRGNCNAGNNREENLCILVYIAQCLLQCSENIQELRTLAMLLPQEVFCEKRSLFSYILNGAERLIL